MVKNKAIDLNNHLFEQLERLNDESLSWDDLEKEIERSKSMTMIGRSIIENAKLSLEAEKFKANFTGKAEMPKMLE